MLSKMIYFTTILLCFLCVNSRSQKVPVTVYYESLCPDSQKFFTTQLHPLLQSNMSKWVNLTLVPYGKSNHVQVNSDQWQFTCHHGPYECYGNKMQACALHTIEKTAPTPEGLGFNPITVDFINCLMGTTKKITDPNTGANSYNFPLADCATNNNVPNFLSIDNCVNHTDGSKYLSEFGEQTNQFQKPLKSVPTIVFNNVYNEELSKDAFNSFRKVLCKQLTQSPEECNHAQILNASALLVMLTSIKLLF